MKSLHTYVGDIHLVTVTIEEHFRGLDQRQFLVSSESLQAKDYTSTALALASKAQNLANAGHQHFIVEYYLKTSSGILAESCKANELAPTACTGASFASSLTTNATAQIAASSFNMVRI